MKMSFAVAAFVPSLKGFVYECFLISEEKDQNNFWLAVAFI